MALNFPSDTSLPYVDPVSGLKYIYNPSIGAWESAIQPPVVISSTPPTGIQIPGFLWWDKEGGSLYVYYKDANGSQWVEAVPAGDQGSARISTDETPPENPTDGDMWWDDVNGRLYIWYTDVDSSQWLDASPNSGGGGGNSGGGNTNIYQGETPPTQPLINDLWFNTKTGNLNIYYEDTDGFQWVICQNFNGVGGASGGSSIVNIQTTLPIVKSGTPQVPIIGINTATTTATGSIRIGTQTEATSASLTTVALTPGTLKGAIFNDPTTYLPSASTSNQGVVALASTAEVSAGTDPNTAVTPKALKDSLPTLGLSVPAGSVIAFAGSTAPTGYLQADGSAISRTTYVDLFAAIGTTYGVGDGATTFNLPDLRGEFVRGWDDGRGADDGRGFGTFQTDELRSHAHTGPSGPAGSDANKTGGGQRTSDTGQYETNYFPVTANTETRPRNVALLYCIKS